MASRYRAESIRFHFACQIVNFWFEKLFLIASLYLDYFTLDPSYNHAADVGQCSCEAIFGRDIEGNGGRGTLIVKVDCET